MVQVGVVRCGEDEFFTVKGFEIVNEVVDHIVAVDDRLATAEDKLLPFEKWKVLTEPLQLFRERQGEFHGGGNNEYLVFPVEFFHDLPAVFFHGHGAKEVLAERELCHDTVMVGKAFVFTLAVQDGPVDPDPELHFIIADKLPGGVRHDIVHINN